MTALTIGPRRPTAQQLSDMRPDWQPLCGLMAAHLAMVLEKPGSIPRRRGAGDFLRWHQRQVAMYDAALAAYVALPDEDGIYAVGPEDLAARMLELEEL